MTLFRRKKRSHNVWILVSGVALAVVTAVVLANFADIKRYIRINTM
jgi:hypothetical protein